MADLEKMSSDELTLLGGQLRSEHLRRRGSYQRCLHCGTEWLARRGALYCSARCRVSAFRARKELSHD